MSEIFYPPLMGMFCTGYVVHLAWCAWEHRRARRLRWIFDFDQKIEEITWKVLELTPGDLGGGK